MPGANKYSVATTNRFMLDSAGDSSGSEDEGNIQNQDPFAMLKQAEVDAVKNAKQAQKDKAKAEKDAKLAAKKAATAAITGNTDDAKKVDNRRNDRPRREPRGNQQQRRGPRQERAPRDGEQAVAENNNGQVSENKRPPRNNDRRRGNDRKSGDPRTGYKGQDEKRGGRGKGNWGDKTENPEDAPVEQVTDENAEKEEKKVDGEEAEEEQAPEEPVEVQLTLEEYMASLSATTSNASTKARKANDGEELKGQQYQAKKVHHEKARKFGGHEREDKKFVIDSKDLGFKSGSGRGGFFYDGDRNDDRRGGRGGRGGGRGGARNQGNRGGDNRRQDSQPKAFNMKSLNDEAFPTLGGK